MTAEDPRLESLRHHIEETERDLRDLGYRVERCVTPPGIRLSDQIFDERCLILVLFGSLRIKSNEETLLLGAGDRVEIPSGVPYALEADGEAAAYWLQARISERIPPRETSPSS